MGVTEMFRGLETIELQAVRREEVYRWATVRSPSAVKVWRAEPAI